MRYGVNFCDVDLVAVAPELGVGVEVADATTRPDGNPVAVAVLKPLKVDVPPLSRSDSSVVVGAGLVANVMEEGAPSLSDGADDVAGTDVDDEVDGDGETADATRTAVEAGGGFGAAAGNDTDILGGDVVLKVPPGGGAGDFCCLCDR